MHLRAAELMAFDEMTLFADDFQSYIAQAAELHMYGVDNMYGIIYL
jgi:hypothetical protein